jgi:N-methylhydantoinase B
MSVDPISLQVYSSLYTSVAEEMGETLRRTAFSPNIRERLDYSCAVFDAVGRMIAQAAHIPVHLGSMPESVRSALTVFTDLGEGDVVILNDPYRGGTHLPDITMVSPVMFDGRAAFYVASRAHHADVGGMSPGSLPLSTELYQEGLIIPPIKFVEGGRLNAAVMSLLTANSRGPDERIGDFEAQLSANRAGAERLRGMIEERGIGEMAEHSGALLDYARRMTEAVISAIPDGQYRFSDALEGDGQSDEEIPIHVEIRVDGSQMQVDFTGTSPQVRGNVNTVKAVAQSATWYCIRLLAGDDVPVNDGCFVPIEVIVPRGSVLDAAFPAAVAVGNTETGQRVVDAVLGALAQALPGQIPAASQGSMNNVTIGVGGRVYYETIAGGHGGSPAGDGISGRHSHMTNTRNTPVEALERAYPLRVLAYHLREDSGGDGQFHGGEGIIREYETLATATATINAERRTLRPYGLAGGSGGVAGKNIVQRANGDEETLAAKATVTLEAGDRLAIETPGGGGWGSLQQ